MEAIWK